MISFVLRRLAVLAYLGALAGCGGPGGPPLVSAQSPPTVSAANAEPQPIDSLPPGAANLGSAPNAEQPDYLSWTFGRGRR